MTLDLLRKGVDATAQIEALRQWAPGDTRRLSVGAPDMWRAIHRLEVDSMREPKLKGELIEAWRDGATWLKEQGK